MAPLCGLVVKRRPKDRTRLERIFHSRAPIDTSGVCASRGMVWSATVRRWPTASAMPSPQCSGRPSRSPARRRAARRFDVPPTRRLLSPGVARRDTVATPARRGRRCGRVRRALEGVHAQDVSPGISHAAPLVSSPSSAWHKSALSQPDRAQPHRELRPLPGGPHRAVDPPQEREHLCYRFARRHTSAPCTPNRRTSSAIEKIERCSCASTNFVTSSARGGR